VKLTHRQMRRWEKYQRACMDRMVRRARSVAPPLSLRERLAAYLAARPTRGLFGRFGGGRDQS
jgi:hypothetical protein